MLNNATNYKSQFRILKGGKIALVISALLVGSSLVHADTQTVSTAVTSNYVIADGDGLEVTSTGSITETGDYAIENAGTVTSITNQGTITTSSSGDDAIYLDGTVSGSITNDGTVSHTGGATANDSAIEINQGYVSGSITNNGTITSSADNGIAVWGDDDNDQSDNLGVVLGGIINNGTITAYNEALDLDDDARIENGITNNGTITGQNDDAIEIDEETVINGGILNNSGATIKSLASDAISITEDSIVNGGITNYGTLEGISSAILLHNDDGDASLIVSGGITNYGTMKSDEYTISIWYNSILNDGITNYGTIQGGQEAIDIYDNSTFNGDIKNYGTIIGNDYSIWIEDTTTFTGDIYNYKGAIVAGTIDINSTGTIDFTNSGLLALKDNITLGSEKTTGDASSSALVGNYIQTSTGEVNFALDSNTTAGTTYSNFAITGDATFSSNAKISLDIKNNGSNINNSDVFQDVVTTTGTLTTSTFDVTDNSLAWKFTAVNDGSNIDITATSTGLTTVAAASDDKNKGAGTALDAITDDDVKNAIGSLNSTSEVQDAVDTTTPQTVSASVGASSQISNGIAGIVEQRQNVNIDVGTFGGNSGDEMFTQKNMWIKPFGSFGKQNDKDGTNGFDLTTSGFGIGFDGEYKQNQNFGIAIFYTNANVDVNNVSQKSDLDVYTLLGYGNIPVIDDKTNFLYQFGYAWQKTKSTRDVFTGNTARSDYTSKTASLDLKLLRDYKVNNKFLLQPMVTTTYRHYTNPAYSETGAGALNLNVEKFTSSELLLGIGSMIHYKLDEDSKIVSNVNVEYDLHDKSQTVTSAYQGATGTSFSTSGIDNGRWSYDIGVGYEKDLDENSNFNISYNRQGQGSDFSNNVISAKFVYEF